MAYITTYKILVIANEYRTYTVEARDDDEATEFFKNAWENYEYERGDDTGEVPEIAEVWEA